MPDRPVDGLIAARSDIGEGGAILNYSCAMRFLAISPSQATFESRGFHTGSKSARAALERHGSSFVHGYNVALETRSVDLLADRLSDVAAADRGFAYEGAAMAFALLDLLVPGHRDRLAELLHGPGQAHVYMVHVGAGWALARLRLRARRRLPSLDPFLRWLTLDGYGFHEGFFHTNRTLVHCTVPRGLSGYERRVFDQGLGRALWFADGADIARAATTVARFPPARHGDLWSGLALAASYTTAADTEVLQQLRSLACRHAPQVAQGAAFAITARHRAANVVEHTEEAARVLCAMTIEEVVNLVAAARVGLMADECGQSYERWRTVIGQRISQHAAAVAV